MICDITPKCKCGRLMKIRERSEFASGSGVYVFPIIGTDKIRAQFYCDFSWDSSMNHEEAIVEVQRDKWADYWETVKHQYLEEHLL